MGALNVYSKQIKTKPFRKGDGKLSNPKKFQIIKGANDNCIEILETFYDVHYNVDEPPHELDAQEVLSMMEKLRLCVVVVKDVLA